MVEQTAVWATAGDVSAPFPTFAATQQEQNAPANRLQHKLFLSNAAHK